MTVGMVGVGKISGQYLDYLHDYGDEAGLKLTAVADLDRDRANAVAARHSGTRSLTVDELCACDEVDMVLNLTVPEAHATIAHAAIAHRKHVYGEKPLAADRDAASGVLNAAEIAGVRVGSAPDTVLGTGVQTARAVLDSGEVGRPIAATAFWGSPGHEAWHPDPGFYYRAGGGPLLDMGPYYITSLIQLLGPVGDVTGAASRARSKRDIASGPKAGQQFRVEVDTHVAGILRHADGPVSSVTTSFDVPGTRVPRIEVYASGGTVSVPDPNHFDGPVEVLFAGEREWRAIPPSGGYRDAGRGVGLADLARAVRTGGEHRASGEVAYHVLDVMESLLESSTSDSRVSVGSTCRRPAAVPPASRVHEA